MSARWICVTLAAIAVLLEATGAAAVDFGAPRYVLNGQSAPPASLSHVGLTLLASGDGPQVAILDRPGSFLLDLRSAENVELAVPVRSIKAGCVVEAEVRLLAGHEAEVSLAAADADSWRMVQGNELLKLRLPLEHDGVLRIKSRAKSADATLRWTNLHLVAGDQAIELPIAVPSCELGQGAPPVLPAMRPAIEQALIQWDWRMQDGIGTPNEPSTYAAAIQRTFQRGDSLIADLRAAKGALAEQAAAWQQLKEQFKSLSGVADADPRWEDLWQRVHTARRGIALANPQLGQCPIALVKQVPSMFSHQLTQYYGSCARPGGGVFILEKPGESMQCRQVAAELPLGSYQHLDVSYDGSHLLFAYVKTDSTPPDREKYLDRTYHLYEVAADGSGLKQLTSGPYDDFAPRYLPDGKLVFTSTRRGGYHRCGRGPCAVYTLALAERDGSNPRTISFHETQEWDPSVLSDGRVIYTRWDYVDRNAVFYQQLWSVRPDGSDVRIFYGNNTLNPVGIWEAKSIPGSQRIMATAGAHHAMTAGSIILVDPTCGVDGPGPITRLTPDALFPESEAPVYLSPKGQWHSPIGVKKPLVVPVEAKRWPGHCYRAAWPLSETYFLAAYSFDRLIGEPTWNRPNMFGLYLVDRFGNKELLYRDLNISTIWAMPLAARPKPAALPSLVQSSPKKAEGAFFLHNVYESWPPLAAGSVKRLRIVQVLPKSTPHANTPPVGAAFASPGKQVLGTVPVEEDGSAYFRAPSGVALSFQALDGSGQALQIMRSITYLQPGETSSCVGCHEHRMTAPAQRRSPLAMSRDPSPITPGPDGSNPLSYPILIQPVLDKACVSCHRRDKAEGKVILTGEPQGQYTASYNALVSRVHYSAWGLPDNSEPATMPGRFGAMNSPLMQLLRKGHAGVTLSSDDLERLVTWIDANALFYGTFNPADQARQLRGQRIAGPDIQ